MGTNFDVTAILKANVSDFSSGMKEAQASLQSLKHQTGSSLDKVSNSLSAVGASAMKLGGGLTATLTAPTVAGVTSIVKSFADLEQSLGGVETLFKDNGISAIGLAKKYNITAKEAQAMYDTMEAKGASVLSNANNAFKTAGISANEYMQQVTSFSATLLQGLGGDTEKAAQYADKALIQMADNANKMGTDMRSIQEAYQGFAKDNFTLLDNLKLGYGGTASEMARLVNESGVLNGEFEATAQNVKDIPFHTLIEAIGITQDRLGITGTTAKEASETVSGSFQAMKASFENLVAGLGHGEADIYGLFENLKETVLTFKDNVVRVLLTIWDNLPLEPWQKWLGLIAVSAGPALIVIGGVISVISKLVGTISFIAGAVSKVSAWFTLLNSGGSALSVTFAKIVGVVSSLGAPFLVVIAVIASLIAILVGVYNTSEEFRNKVNSAFEAVKTAITNAIQEAVSFVQDIWGTLVSWWSENHELIERVATKVWNAIKTVVETVTNFLAPIIESAWNAIGTTISVVWGLIKSTIGAGLDFILGIIKAVMQIIDGDWSGAWETIKETASRLWENIKNIIQQHLDGIIQIFSGIFEFLKTVWETGWNALITFLAPIWEGIKSAVQTGIEAVTTFFQTSMTGIQTTWENVWNTITAFIGPIWTAIYETIYTTLTTIWTYIQTGLEFIQSIWSSAWEIIKAVFAAILLVIVGLVTGNFDLIKEAISNAWTRENK